MNKLLTGLLILFIILAGFFYFQNNSALENKEVIENSDLNKTENIIEFTEEGYLPSSLTINKGETVTFVNKADKSTWPASNVHPTHTVYPKSDIQKCGTSEEAKIFDACKELAKGETYSFTFNEEGKWEYHDHLSARKKGTIIVQ